MSPKPFSELATHPILVLAWTQSSKRIIAFGWSATQRGSSSFMRAALTWAARLIGRQVKINLNALVMAAGTTARALTLKDPLPAPWIVPK